MKREKIAVRQGWRNIVAEQGLSYYLTDGKPYWDESACYCFSSDEIDVLEEATQELHGMCLDAVDYVVTNNMFDKFHIKPDFAKYIKISWEQKHPYVFGRFDFSYDGNTPPKMLEYNADTPTTLPEAAVIQWYWLEDKINSGELPANADQFNSIHDSLIAAWTQVKQEVSIPKVLYFTGNLDVCDDEPDTWEDHQNLQYMRDTCREAGIESELINLSDIGWNGRRFTDLKERPIDAMFKLYPWEFIMADKFGQHFLNNRTGVIEAPWKAILSNKAILPVLWEMYPDHPNLLPAYFEAGKIKGDYVIKPILGREGQNVTIVSGKDKLATEGVYGAEGFVYQKLHALPNFDGRFPTIGSWVTSERPKPETELTVFDRGGRSCGIGVREEHTPITTNKSQFVPHYFINQSRPGLG